MKIHFLIFSLILSLVFSCEENPKPASSIGKVSITGIELLEGSNPAGRTQATFVWEHVYTNQLQVTFTESDGEKFSLSLNPNDFSSVYVIDLPFGNYDYIGTSTSPNLSETLPITVSGQIQVDTSTESLLLKASSEFGLFTFSRANLSIAPKTIGPAAGTLSSSSDFYYTYVKDNLLLKTELSLSNGNSFRVVSSAENFTHQHFHLSSSSSETPDSFQKVDFDISNEVLILGENGFPSVLFPYNLNELGSPLNETSGLQLIQGRLFSINDSGNSAEIQEINPENGSLIRTIKVTNAPNVDWEDLAASPTHLFIGDFGSNVGNRTDLKILKIPIPNLLGQSEVVAEIIEFSYPDQSDFSGATPNHNFDCEAMIYWENQLHLFSKNWGDERTKHYTISTSTGKQAAVLMESFDSKGLITGADVSPDGKNVVLLGYENKGISSRSFVWTFSSVSGSVFSNSGNQFFLGSPAGLGQTEGIVIDSEMELTISGERISFSGLTVPPKIFRIDLDGIFTP